MRNHAIETAENRGRQVRRLEGQLDQLDRDLAADGVSAPRREWILQLELPAAPRGGDVVASARGAVVRRGDFTLGPVTCEVRHGDRIHLLGANGSGKSTLLQVLLGDVAPDEGVARLGEGVVVGRLDQARAALRTDADVVQVVTRLAGVDAQAARGMLGRFGLRRHEVQRPAGSLSPGERTRALLAVLQLRPTTLLVLDEPTNHLDLPALTQLEEALEDYAGTVLLVTHDRRLARSFRTTRRWQADAGRVVEVA